MNENEQLERLHTYSEYTHLRVVGDFLLLCGRRFRLGWAAKPDTKDWEVTCPKCIELAGTRLEQA